jgi:crossover junction endodeoxyribonuclease RuvC
MTHFVGIDPGLTGAVVFIDRDAGLRSAVRTPVLTGTGQKTVYDLRGMTDLLRSVDISLVTLEQVTAMPHDGVTSAFRFGTGYGIWLGLISGLQLPLLQVKPQAWQKTALAGRPRGKAIKTSSVAAAQERWPTLPIRYKRDWGMADAVHIADYGRRLTLAQDRNV